MNDVKILLAIDHKENRRLLQDYLEQRYTIILSDSDDSLNESFDLAIFDGITLNRLWKQIRERKEHEDAVFLPFLMVTSRQDVRMVTRQLGQSLDELIFTPIEKIELLARVEILLRARRLSLELAGRNIELQQEIIAHKESQAALRVSEERTRLLQKLTAELAKVITSADLAQLIADRVCREVSGTSGTIAMLSRSEGEVEILATGERISLDVESPITEVISTGDALWLENQDELIARFPGLRAEFERMNTQAECVTPVMISGQTIGAVSFSFHQPRHFTEDDRAFFQILAQECAQALERARSYESESERAAAEERQRIARDLHDSVSQNLFAISVIGQTLPHLLQRNPTRATQRMQELVMLTRSATLEMQSLLSELLPTRLLRSSLKDLFAQLIKMAQSRREIAITSQVEFADKLPDNVHIALYRIVQEGLNNIIKHSGATEASILLKSENDKLILRMRDNGCGFDPQTRAVGLGLEGMRERAAMIGASYDVFSQKDRGTEIILSWSIHHEDQQIAP